MHAPTHRCCPSRAPTSSRQSINSCNKACPLSCLVSFTKTNLEVMHMRFQCKTFFVWPNSSHISKTTSVSIRGMTRSCDGLYVRTVTLLTFYFNIKSLSSKTLSIPSALWLLLLCLYNRAVQSLQTSVCAQDARSSDCACVNYYSLRHNTKWS